MSSKQKQIRDAIVAALTPLVPSGNLFRSPRFTIAEANLPCIAAFSTSDRPAEDDSDHQAPHVRVYSIRVELRAIGRPEEDVLDDLSASVRRAILTDDSLGGLANRITWAEQLWDGSEDESPNAGSAFDFNVFYLWRPE